MPILQLQRRMMELGRVRLGEKGPKGEPKKRDTFRFTTASEDLAKAIAEQHGGTPEPWVDAPNEGYWQVSTDATELDIVLPPVFSDADGSPTTTWSQWFELWSGGGCQRRCDGETEMLSGKPCVCKPAVDGGGEDARECKVTTRLSFMLPDIPGLGVWRLDSHGWNAAMELPGTLEILTRAAAEHAFIPAVLRIEHRVKKEPGKTTKRFVVPVIDLPQVTIKQLAAGEAPLVLNAPRQAPPKPALPAGGPLPADPAFDKDDTPGFGQPPALPAGQHDPETPQGVLLELCAELEVDLEPVRRLIAEHADDPEWTTRQIAKARENLRIRQEKAESEFAKLAETAQKRGRGKKPVGVD